MNHGARIENIDVCLSAKIRILKQITTYNLDYIVNT